MPDISQESFETPPEQIVLDFDATDAPLHGDQEMKFFHGYYDHYCSLSVHAPSLVQESWPISALSLASSLGILTLIPEHVNFYYFFRKPYLAPWAFLENAASGMSGRPSPETGF